jgi:hypothetical protein
MGKPAGVEPGGEKMMCGNYFPILTSISSKGYPNPIVSILLFLSGCDISKTADVFFSYSS